MAIVSDYTALLTGNNWNSSVGVRPVFVTFSFDTSARSYLADAGYSQAAISFGRYDFNLIPDGAGAGLGYYGRVNISSNFATKSEIGREMC